MVARSGRRGRRVRRSRSARRRATGSPSGTGVRVPEEAPLGVRLGFFRAFGGADSILLHGTPAQIGALVSRLYEFVASPREEWPIHDHALVSMRRPVRLFASRLGSSGRTGFRWRCSPAELPTIQARLLELVVSGKGHHDFPLAASTARLIVSTGEYTEVWWHANA